ncbi:MAG: 60S ribosomal export protein NMD3 [Candidatus Marsarchaeota archaeon]|jgi:NMD protein affecting ribosome stability and mRNA decay|nr:60S ribosomal export protein NMD3 [Candidatus Marsarchaeota archaeon]
MPKHCPICNRTSDKTLFYGEFCRYCAESKLDSKLPTSIDVKKCKRCGKIWVGEAFVEPNGLQVEKFLKQKLRGYKVHLMDLNESRVVADISEIDGPSVTKPMALNYISTLCTTCSRKASSYYEAVFQLRGNNSKMLKFIKDVEKYFIKRDGFITKIEEDPNGYNIYLSSKKLASGFVSIHNLKPNMSYTLYGLKNGKKVYRNTYAIRL